MKFAIKHNQKNHYLQKNLWNWVNQLDETTVYTGYEIVARLGAKEFSYGTLRETTQIVLVKATEVYQEIT